MTVVTLVKTRDTIDMIDTKGYSHGLTSTTVFATLGIGCPAGVLPVTRVNLEDEARLENYPVQSDLINKTARDATVGAVGCPVGVQVGQLVRLTSFTVRGFF